jgi:hypothetical protein
LADDFSLLEVPPSIKSHANGFPELLRMHYDPTRRENTATYQMVGEELAN